MKLRHRIANWLNGPPLFGSGGASPSREELGLPSLDKLARDYLEAVKAYHAAHPPRFHTGGAVPSPAEMLEKGQRDARRYHTGGVVGPRPDEVAAQLPRAGERYLSAFVLPKNYRGRRGKPRERETGDTWEAWRSIPDPRGRGWVVVRLGWSDWRQTAVAEFHPGRSADPALALFWFTRFETDRVADLLNKEEAI